MTSNNLRPTLIMMWQIAGDFMNRPQAELKEISADIRLSRIIAISKTYS